MAHQSFLLNSARHLRNLVAEDERDVQAAEERLQYAQASLEDARLRAEASREVLESVEHRLSTVVGPSQDALFAAPAVEEVGATQAPVVDLIREFLRTREEATTGEIIAYVRVARPTTNSSNVSPELSRLMKRGDLVRPRQGVYSIASSGASQEEPV
ncbi:hypothetical protein [Streptomyces sp. NPDC127038]|uniref:hypothetical protein n=1 Tax=Streptomyces sp. NPDC127038 TaxID=3347114 RepID=UPI00364AEFAC